MALSKAAGIIYMRSLLRAKGEIAESEFLAKLSPEEAILYQKILSTEKLPIEVATEMYALSAPLIYSGKSVSESLWQLGYETAQHDLSGKYAILLRIITPEFAIKQAAKIWKTYHDAGVSSTQGIGTKQAVFKIENHPSLPNDFRQVLNGYIIGLCNLVGAKNTKVVRDDSNPEAWEWTITWE